MLAVNYQTPIALGISDVEFVALVNVLGMLERGDIPAQQFNMWVPSHDTECGTPACICGWARRLQPGARVFSHWNSDFTKREWPQQLCNLFVMGADWETCRVLDRGGFDPRSTAQAAIALRNYLTTGAPNWADALQVS